MLNCYQSFCLVQSSHFSYEETEGGEGFCLRPHGASTWASVPSSLDGLWVKTVPWEQHPSLFPSVKGGSATVSLKELLYGLN